MGVKFENTKMLTESMHLKINLIGITRSDMTRIVDIVKTVKRFIWQCAGHVARRLDKRSTT